MNDSQWIYVVGHNVNARCVLANALYGQKVFKDYDSLQLVYKSLIGKKAFPGRTINIANAPNLDTSAWTHEKQRMRSLRNKVFVYVRDLSHCINVNETEINKELQILRSKYHMITVNLYTSAPEHDTDDQTIIGNWQFEKQTQWAIRLLKEIEAQFKLERRVTYIPSAKPEAVKTSIEDTQDPLWIYVVGHNVEERCVLANALYGQKVFEQFSATKLEFKSQVGNKAFPGRKKNIANAPNLDTPAWTQAKQHIHSSKDKVFMYVRDPLRCVNVNETEINTQLKSLKPMNLTAVNCYESEPEHEMDDMTIIRDWLFEKQKEWALRLLKKIETQIKLERRVTDIPSAKPDTAKTAEPMEAAQGLLEESNHQLIAQAMKTAEAKINNQFSTDKQEETEYSESDNDREAMFFGKQEKDKNIGVDGVFGEDNRQKRLSKDLERKPTEVELGRLARYLKEEATPLAIRIKLFLANIVADSVIVDTQNASLRRFQLLMRWKSSNSSGTLKDLFEHLTATKDYHVKEMFSVVQTDKETNFYDLPSEQLDTAPCDMKDITTVSGCIGADYPFLFLELGLQYNDIEHVDHDYSKLTDRVLQLLSRWRQKFPDRSTTRLLLDTIKFIGTDTTEIVKKIQKKNK